VTYSFKPVMQSILHDPKNKKYGDCYPACIASVLGLPLSNVPHFYDNDRRTEHAQDMIDSFFQSVNMKLVSIYYGSAKLKDVLQGMAVHNDGVYYLISGASPRFPDKSDLRHCVVACGGVLVHDPHPDQSFIVDFPKKNPWGILIEVFTPDFAKSDGEHARGVAGRSPDGEV